MRRRAIASASWAIRCSIASSREQDRAATLARHGFKPRSRLLALMPGSRRGEIRYLLRPMLEAARVLAGDHDLTPVIILAPTLTVADLRDRRRCRAR